MFTGEALHALRGNRRVLRDRAARELRHTPRPIQETLADLHAWFAACGTVRATGRSPDRQRTQRTPVTAA